MQGVGALVWTNAWGDGQLGVSGLGHHGDTFISGRQLFVSKAPLGGGSWVSSDGNSDGERLRSNDLQTIPECT